MQVNPTSSTESESGSRLAVDFRRLPGIRRFAADYAYAFDALAPYFAGDPATPASWADTIARTQAHDRGRAEIAAIIGAQQVRRGAPAEAVAAGAKLADRQTVAILTGQQAGLFGGPLFTLLKALTALKLADEVAREHHVPAIAIFWIDAEDHDWEEVRGCTVFDEHLAPHSVALPHRPADEHAPVASVQLDHSITAALDQLAAILPATEFSDGLITQLRAAYQPGVGMAEGFGRWLESVLGHRGLVVYDSSDPATKPLVASLFARELSQPGVTSELAESAGHALVGLGYHAQVHHGEHHPSLFQMLGSRRPIKFRDGTFIVADQEIPSAAMVADAQAHPEHFSPNVLLRPLVQDTLFPTICYVAGPNELAYLGQLRGVYAHFGIPMPLMYQRATATLVDSAALRFLTKYQLPIEALQAQDEAALNELLATQIPKSVDDAYADATRATEQVMSALIKAMPALDPTLEGAAKSTLGRMQHDLQTLHNKIIQAAKRRDETLRRQFMRTRALTFPNGHAQERTVGFVSFLNQYGPALVERLEEQLPLGMGWHWVLSI